MSDNHEDDAINHLLGEYDERQSLSEMERKVKTHRLKSQVRSIENQEANMAKLSQLDIRGVSDTQIEQMNKEHEMMRESLKSSIPFICPTLTSFFNFSYPSLVFIGAKSGQGKSTFTANLAYSLLVDKRKSGEKRKILILSNEEMSLSVYNRLGCLHLGYNLNDVKNFTDEQHENLKKFRTGVAKAGRVRVIDPSYDGVEGATTSYEGLVAILDNLLKKHKEKVAQNPDAEADFDAIIIDYYQKINESKETSEPTWAVLKKVSDYLDNYYKQYPAPVVVFGQIKPESKDDDVDSFEYRIKDGKSIFIPATIALELKPVKEESRTEVILQKARWSSEQGKSVNVGWDKGLIVDYTDEFKLKKAQEREERAHKNMMAGVKPKND